MRLGFRGPKHPQDFNPWANRNSFASFQPGKKPEVCHGFPVARGRDFLEQ